MSIEEDELKNRSKQFALTVIFDLLVESNSKWPRGTLLSRTARFVMINA